MPFLEFHNDLLVSGLALCKKHHWALIAVGLALMIIIEF